MLHLIAKAQPFSIFNNETEAGDYHQEPIVCDSQDQYIRKITLSDTNLPVARIEKGTVYIWPEDKTKYKVIYNKYGQSVHFYDWSYKRWGTKRIYKEPHFLITSPYTKAIYESDEKPKNGVYKDRASERLYLILSKQERYKLQNRLKKVKLNSDEGYPAKSIFKVGDKVTFNLNNRTKITGTVLDRNIDEISISIESKIIKKAKYTKKFTWNDIKQEFLEQLMPERYAAIMLADGYRKYKGRWVKKSIAERNEMTAKGFVKYQNSWITKKEYRDLTFYIKLPRY